MKTQIALALCATFTASAAPADTGLTTPEYLAENIATFPKLTATDVAAQKVNAVLTEIETAGLEELKTCDGSRDARVTLHNAAYYSLFVSEGGMCEGAAHPFYDQQVLTFDLATGAQVDWAQVLPKTLLDPDAEDYDANYPLRSAALSKAYLAGLKNPDPECNVVYNDPLDFTFWLDGDAHALAMMPAELPYAETACGETAYLPAAQLQALGFDPKLVQALTDTP